MKISKTHQRLANSLQGHNVTPKQNVLDHPENYLGPNWEEVINFWLYLDILNVDQLRVVEERYFDLNVEENNIARGKVWNASKDATECSALAGSSASFCVLCANTVARRATYELIGLDKLLAQGHQPLFFPLFLNL